MMETVSQNGKTGAKTAETDAYLLFLVGGQHHALPASAVEEIVGPREAVRVPGVPEFVRGVMNLRGRVVPLVDLHALLGRPGAAQPPDAAVIVAVLDGFTVGLLADAVTRVVRIAAEEVHPQPGGRGGRVATVDGAPVLFTDIPALLKG